MTQITLTEENVAQFFYDKSQSVMNTVNNKINDATQAFIQEFLTDENNPERLEIEKEANYGKYKVVLRQLPYYKVKAFKQMGFYTKHIQNTVYTISWYKEEPESTELKET